jgi:hypothetical protein
MHTKLWSGNLNRRDHLEHLFTTGKIILELILEEYGGKLWNGFIVITTKTCGELL